MSGDKCASPTGRERETTVKLNKVVYHRLQNRGCTWYRCSPVSSNRIVVVAGTAAAGLSKTGTTLSLYHYIISLYHYLYITILLITGVLDNSTLSLHHYISISLTAASDLGKTGH